MEPSIPKVYAAIAAVQADLCKVGISKDRKNLTQNYAFRGIDDIYGAVAPLLSTHGLCILPNYRNRAMEIAESKQGGNLFYVTVEGVFDFVCVNDGSKHTVTMFGEAMDSGDKATNKAQSAAYKYACLQVFCIPTEGDNDADAKTPEPAAKTPPAYAKPRTTKPDAKAGPSIAACREKMLKVLEEQFHPTLIKGFAVCAGLISDSQAITDWPDAAVVKTAPQRDQLLDALKVFENDNNIAVWPPVASENSDWRGYAAAPFMKDKNKMKFGTLGQASDAGQLEYWIKNYVPKDDKFKESNQELRAMLDAAAKELGV